MTRQCAAVVLLLSRAWLHVGDHRTQVVTLRVKGNFLVSIVRVVSRNVPLGRAMT